MKLLCALLLICLVNVCLIDATYYDHGVITTYRVRRSGVKSSSSGQYVQQRVEQNSYDSGALLGGSAQRGNVRTLPARPSTGYRVPSQQYQQQEGQYSGGSGQADAEPASYGGVQGQPGKDFPAYGQVPRTSFTCSGVPYEPGMYADEETQCQAYHVCFQGRKESFLCGVGTVFNQAILACDYWHSVECSRSREFYSANAELGKAGAEPSSGGGSAQVTSSQSNKWSQQQQQQPQPRPRPQPPARQQYQPQQQQQQQQYASSSQYDQAAVAGQWGQQQQQQQQVQQYGRSKSTAQQYQPARQAPVQYNVQSSAAQYGGQQVESVSQYTDQAAVRANQVAPVVVAPQPQRPVAQYRPSGGAQPYRKSKYRSGAAGNQLSPSYRSKALSQVQQQFSQNDGQYVQQQQQQQPYRAPQQQRPYKAQPNQLPVDTFRDTQQKLVY